MEKFKKLPRKSNGNTTKEDDLTMSTIDNVSLEAPKLQEVVEGVSDIEVGDAIASLILDDIKSQSHSSSFKHPDSGGNHRSRSDSGVATVVNSKEGSEFCTLEISVVEGKMVVFPSEVIKYIGNPPYIEILIGEGEMFLVPMIDEAPVPLKVRDNKYIAYSEKLFDFISGSFNLDFSCRTSFTFYGLEYKQLDGEDIATCFFVD